MQQDAEFLKSLDSVDGATILAMIDSDEKMRPQILETLKTQKNIFICTKTDIARFLALCPMAEVLVTGPDFEVDVIDLAVICKSHLKNIITHKHGMKPIEIAPSRLATIIPYLTMLSKNN